MQDLIWLIEDLLDSFGGIIAVIVAVVVVVNAVKKSKNKPAQRPEVPAPAAAVQPAQRPAPRPAAAQAARTAKQAAEAFQEAAVQLRMNLDAAPKADGSLNHASDEGVELHEPGFHGGAAPRLQKADLGALRALESAHTAGNADWRMPEEIPLSVQPAAAAGRPRYTAAQLREAFIMKEILDAPLARRQGVKRRYGR